MYSCQCDNTSVYLARRCCGALSYTMPAGLVAHPAVLTTALAALISAYALKQQHKRPRSKLEQDRPQRRFRTTNTATASFEHLASDDHGHSNVDDSQHGFESDHVMFHPYGAAIEQLVARPPLPFDPSHYPPLPQSTADSPLIIVNSKRMLRRLVDDLRKESHLAIDTEHNAVRSYLGITCLLQISTGRVCQSTKCFLPWQFLFTSLDWYTM